MSLRGEAEAISLDKQEIATHPSGACTDREERVFRLKSLNLGKNFLSLHVPHDLSKERQRPFNSGCKFCTVT